MEQRKFQGQYQRSGPRSYKAADYSTGFAKRDAWLKQGESEYLQSMRRNAAIEKQNAAQPNALQEFGKLAKPLAEFSKTLKTFQEEQEKERKAQAEADAEVAALMGGGLGTEQADAMDDLSKQESIVTNNYETNTGDADGATYMRETMGEVSGTTAFQGQTMTMQQARGMYAGSLSAYLASDATITIDGQTMPVRQAILDQRYIGTVINSYPAQFLRQAGLTGLDGAGRQQLAKTLAGTVWTTNGQTITSLTNAATKATRTQADQQVAGRIYQTASTGVVGVEQQFREASSGFLMSKGGYNQTTANQKAVETLLDTYESRGDEESIRALGRIQQVPGQPGSELINIYGKEINEALVKAADRDKKLDGIVLRTAKQEMARELRGVTSPTERLNILNKYADQLDSDGFALEANELRGTAQANSQTGQQAINEVLLRDSIKEGGDVTQQTLDDALAQNDITERAHKTLSEKLKPVDMTKNETYKDVRKGELKALKTQLMTTWGLKKDALGNTIAGVDRPLVSPDAADSILARLEMDWDKAMSTALVRAGVEGPEAIAEELTEMSKAWAKDNLMTKGGKYDISDVYGADDAAEGYDAKREAAAKRFKQLNTAEGLNNNARNRTLAPYVTPRIYSDSYDLGQPVPQHIRDNFRPGRKDKLLDQTETSSLLGQWQSGKVPESLRKTAQGLGISELELLNSQARAWGLDPIAPTLTQDTSGTTQLIQSGVPSTNAAALMKITQTQQQALDVLGKYESPNHGYNAVNQVGYNAGRGARGSGHYSSIGGRNLTDVTVGEIMSLQEARPGMSDAQWMAEGRLHAVGRYQFTRDTFKEYAQKLGIDPNARFTPELQDQMALALMKDRGIQPWVGPRDKATDAERQLVYSATDELRQKQAQAILKNPYATGRQLARTHSYMQRSDTGPQLVPQSTVPYVDQRTAINGAGDRQCFSASATMLANAFGVNVSYDKYNTIRGKYGDTTDPNAQVKALQELGIQASVQDNGSLNEVATSVSSGKPVAVGIMHTPGGSGHWIVVTGVTPNGDFIVHDPFGKLIQSRGGGWAYTNSGSNQAGRNAVYSRDFMYSIFEDRGPGTGRIMRIA
jgi:hypothetical protein